LKKKRLEESSGGKEEGMWTSLRPYHCETLHRDASNDDEGFNAVLKKIAHELTHGTLWASNLSVAVLAIEREPVLEQSLAERVTKDECGDGRHEGKPQIASAGGAAKEAPATVHLLSGRALSAP
jgi:hypothetical protein